MTNIPTKTLKLKPTILKRTPNTMVMQQLIKSGFDETIAKIVASRLINSNNLSKCLSPKLADLDSPDLLADIDNAASRIATAILNQEVIGIETDHDCDGQTSHAVIYWCLTHHFSHPKDKIQHYIGHRLEEGYGLSDKLTARIIDSKVKPNLIITADNGSSDEKNIEILRSHKIETIVTDHHQLPVAGPPKSAVACVNPTRLDCKYPDKAIAGCMVAWLVMAATRNKLIEKNHLSATANKLQDCLDFVAVGTVADCVSMATSHNNRIVVHYGLKLINKKIRACWQALGLSETNFTAETLGFKVGPLLNSDGRLASAMQAVKFLLSTDINIAINQLKKLEEQNTARKKIQQQITSKALEYATQEYNSNSKSICIYLPDGHSGVHGISASRLKDYFGLPTIIFSPKANENEIISGSARSIDELDIKQVLDEVKLENQEIILSYGGHKGAAGITILKQNFSAFNKIFKAVCKKKLVEITTGPKILSDGQIPANKISLEFYRQLMQIAPYGREFDFPIFEAKAQIIDLYPVGNGLHAKVKLRIEEQEFNAIWFNYKQNVNAKAEFQSLASVNAAFQIKVNYFNHRNYLSLNIITILATSKSNRQPCV